MSFYETLYNNLCKKGRGLKEFYKPGSGLHAHHIVPKHSGGHDDDDNITFLTPREHKIAHFLLWKMFNNPNDLRSMYMLGAELSVERRRIIGLFCKENNIGFFGASKEVRDAGRKKAATKAYMAQKGIHDPKMKAIYTSIGGKASWASNNNTMFKYWASPEGRKQRSKMGAAKSGKFPATNNIITKKFKTKEDRLLFINSNVGWRVGVHHSNPNKGKKTNKPSQHRKAVKIDDVMFPSVFHAGQYYGVTSATVINRCKSEKTQWVNWQYVS
jgi:hypothetical protein